MKSNNFSFFRINLNTLSMFYAQCDNKRSMYEFEAKVIDDVNSACAGSHLHSHGIYFYLQSWVFWIVGMSNMKQARPWMLAFLKIIWQFHAHPVHQKVSRFFGPRYIGDDFFLGPNLASFNRTIVSYQISKVNFRVESKILNKLKISI
jgi:hypothetical protein